MSEKRSWTDRLAAGGGGSPEKISRRRIWWLAGAILLGISLIVLGSGSQKSPPPSQDKKAGPVEAAEMPEERAVKTIMAAEELALAEKLQAMLERIEGSGNVRVTVRLATSSRETYATNSTTGRKTTVEKDQGGGTRTITENSDTVQMVMSRSGKGDQPVVEMESASGVAGVLVVSSGAGNPRVRERLFEAVRVALNVEPHRILVLTGR